MVKIDAATSVTKTKRENDVARHWIREMKALTSVRPICVGNQVWIYTPVSGRWTLYSADEIETDVCKNFPHVPYTTISKALKFIPVYCRVDENGVKIKQDCFNSVTGIAFTNGYINLNGKFSIKGPDNRASFGYDFAYTFGLTPKKFLKFLAEVFSPDADKTKKVSALQEFIGAALFGTANLYEKVFFLYGMTGNNGKSVLISLLTKLFPPESQSAVRPSDWDNEYYLAEMMHSRLNICDELQAREILDSANFKTIVSGVNAISGRQIREKVQKFKPKAAHIFATNTLVPVGDPGPAFWKRVFPLGFNRTFDHKISRETIFTELEKEIPEIISWAIDGAVRLEKTGHYTVVPSSADIIRSWKNRSDVISAFIAETCRIDKYENALSGKTGAHELYVAYKLYARNAGCEKHLLSTAAFKERMALLNLGAKRESKGIYYPVELLPENQWATMGSFFRERKKFFQKEDMNPVSHGPVSHEAGF